LACLIKGLLKPSEGKIKFAGRKDSGKNFCKVGVVFQNSENQLFEENVLKDVMFGPKNLGFNENDAKIKAIASLKDVGFDQEKIYESPFELSGGEKKLVAIAGILAMEPEILIFDEPTAGLDIFAKYVFLKLLFNLHQEKNNTIIFISHSYQDIELIANRILTIENKKIIEIA
jgi:energy-coupling factor transport system ATP-binding protein